MPSACLAAGSSGLLSSRFCNRLVRVNGIPRALHGWSQPQRRPGGFHGPVDHSKQLGREGVQVHFVAEAGAEGLDRPGRVVATPVEAPVHGGLDAAAGRSEHCCRGQGRGSDQPARRVRTGAGHQHEQQRSGHIAQPEGRGEQPVDQGAVDDPVDVVQPVLQHRDRDGQQQSKCGRIVEHVQPGHSLLGQQPRGVSNDQNHRLEPVKQPSVGDPLQLLALLTP
jgi:hypothetical protein